MKKTHFHLFLSTAFFFMVAGTSCTFKPNGNLCEPDTAKYCLGVQGISREANVACLKSHFADLSADCQKVMAPENEAH